MTTYGFILDSISTTIHSTSPCPQTAQYVQDRCPLPPDPTGGSCTCKWILTTHTHVEIDSTPQTFC